MVALVPPRTEASAFPYMRESKTCRQRLIGQSALELEAFFRRAKCREALSWPCLPIPQVISQGSSRESRLAYDRANHRKCKRY
jgi:hypothetical protein